MPVREGGRRPFAAQDLKATECSCVQVKERCGGSACSRGSVKNQRPLLAGIGDSLAIIGPPVSVEIQSLPRVLKVTLQPQTHFKRCACEDPGHSAIDLSK